MPITSFFAALTGLNANSYALSVVGNNLSNINTIGFKGSRTIFKDLLSSTVSFNGAGQAIQLGLGVTLGGIQNLFTQGSIQNTSVPTDVAIQGNGFFVLGLSGSQGNNFVYTRAGNFGIDAQGYLVNSQGFLVQGYPVSLSNGTVAPNGPLGPVRIPVGSLMTPRPTSMVQLGINLDARVGLSGSPYVTDISVFDPLGQAHKVTFTFNRLNLSGGPSFSFDVTIDGGDINGGTPNQPFSLLTGAPAGAAPGRMIFDSNGKLINITGVPTVNPPANLDIRFPPSTLNLSNGSQLAAGGITWNITQSLGNTPANSTYFLTSYAAPSGTSIKTQNGFASGTLDSIAVGTNGVIQGKFSNQQIAPLGMLAMASFANPEGLIKAGDNLYLSSGLGSGEPNIGQPGSGTRGSLVGGALEMSNVDVAQEFTQLIMAQRGYQANSRVITTSDEVFQESVNLKRS